MGGTTVQNTTSSQNSQSNPWAPTIPTLTNLINSISASSPGGVPYSASGSTGGITPGGGSSGGGGASGSFGGNNPNQSLLFNNGGFGSGGTSSGGAVPSGVPFGSAMTPAQLAATNNLEAAAFSTPNMGPASTGAINNLFSSNNGVPQAGILGDAYNKYRNTMSTYLNPGYLDPRNTPGFGDALSAMNEDITRQVGDMYAGSGRDPTGAGSFAKSLGRGLSQGEGQLIANQFNANVGAQQNAANSVIGNTGTAAQQQTNLMQTPLMNSIAAMQASGSLPGLWMGPAQGEVAAANQQYNLPWQNIQAPESLALPIAGLGGQFVGTGMSTTSTPQNPWTTALGAGLGIGSMAAPGGGSLLGTLMLSDERLKENIEPVGKLDNDLTVYRYNFKGDTRPQIGLLAQEVENTNPEAVVDVPIGAWGDSIKMVNYGLATAA